LIAGFNNFLPPGHKISVEPVPEPKPVPINDIPQPPAPQPHVAGTRTQEELVHAREYVNKIKVLCAAVPCRCRCRCRCRYEQEWRLLVRLIDTLFVALRAAVVVALCRSA